MLLFENTEVKIMLRLVICALNKVAREKDCLGWLPAFFFLNSCL